MSKQKTKREYRLADVRVSLYWLWVALLSLYLLSLLILKTSDNFEPAEINDAIIRILALFVPILTAFLSFWFDDITKKSSDREKVTATRAGVILSATIG